MYWPAYNDMYWPAYDIMPALSKFQPILDITSYLFYNMSMATCNLKWAQLVLVTLCARGMQLLNYRVGHLLRFEFEGTEPECASWTVQPGLCVWVWSLERIVYHSADTLCCCYWLGPGQSSKLGEATNWPSPISSGHNLTGIASQFAMHLGFICDVISVTHMCLNPIKINGNYTFMKLTTWLVFPRVLYVMMWCWDGFERKWTFCYQSSRPRMLTSRLVLPLGHSCQCYYPKVNITVSCVFILCIVLYFSSSR